MKVSGKVEIGAYAADSKSARQHQAFLVLESGERLLLRRTSSPPMRDPKIEALDGLEVVADGERRDRLFVAKSLKRAAKVRAPAPETAPSASRGRSSRKR